MEKKQNIFDKLTNPDLYTGSHKERFDKDGKGKGLAGRVDEVAQKDLKTMVDTKSKTTSNTNNKVVHSSNKEVKEITEKVSKIEIKDNKEQTKKQPNIFDKLTNPDLYTGSHKERFDKDGKGKGLAGRIDDVAQKDLKTMVDTKSKINETKGISNKSNKKIEEEPKEQTKKQPNIFDKLTNPDLYTGSHKERFDKDGKGKGLVGRTDNVGPKQLSGMVNVKK